MTTLVAFAFSQLCSSVDLATISFCVYTCFLTGCTFHWLLFIMSHSHVFPKVTFHTSCILESICCGRPVDFATIRLAALFTPVALEPVASWEESYLRKNNSDTLARVGGDLIRLPLRLCRLGLPIPMTANHLIWQSELSPQCLHLSTVR